jgi:signal transduction histidine kinase
MNAAPDVETRVEHFTRETDLGWVADLLQKRRDEILDRWLRATAKQPFHHGRPERAVADHIPRLFDALVELLKRAAPRSVDPEAPLDDPQVLEAAQEHARVRVAEGLQPADVVVEFRLLRQEIGRTLRFHLADEVPTSDVSAGALLVNDALDGAISVGLSALTRYVEEAREDFLATTIHEVRQPMTTIKGCIQLAVRELSRPEPDAERVTDALRRADAATNRMTAVLATLIDVSRLILSRLELHRTPVDLVEVLHRVIGGLDPEDGGRVRLDVPSGFDATGQWESTALERVIGNLLSNAVKYSPAERPIDVAVRGDAETVQLSVRDRGIGLAADELPRLFRRYGRTHAATDRGIAGLGLGLYLSRGIVEAHGGRIWAESPGPGRGTTMHVFLPRTAPPAPAEP